MWRKAFVRLATLLFLPFFIVGLVTRNWARKEKPTRDDGDPTAAKRQEAKQRDGRSP